jgi:AraC family transcriptional regulator of adaptative response/methylated-DNA-[protein]-cysteine methyltransferase
VRFHDTIAEAEAAGFRPCKRCRPNESSLASQHAASIASACRLIEEAEEAPKLDELAQSVGLSPYHFHRLFKTTTGVTPKAYAVAHRQKRVREKLGRSKSVTEAIYDSGFNSSGRFYADSTHILGMTPSAFREGGVNADIKFAVGECSFGSILVAASNKGITNEMVRSICGWLQPIQQKQEHGRHS